MGNIVSAYAGDRTYTYNSANRLETYSENGVLKSQYRHNAIGQRVRSGANLEKYYHYFLDGKYLSETHTDSAGTEITQQIDYIYLENKPVAQITTFYQDGEPVSDEVIYLQVNHLNAPTVGTNSLGNIVWRWNGDAFGSIAPDEDPDNNVIPTTVNLRFPGQIASAETPFFYNYFRDYDPALGRYLQSDPIGLEGGINTYAMYPEIHLFTLTRKDWT